MSELLYRVALTKIPKVGAVTSKNLIAQCGNAEEVFRTKRETLLKIHGIGTHIADAIKNAAVLNWAERELEFIENHDIRVLYHTDADYPRRLLEQKDCPMLLYYLGSADLNAQRTVAIIGTRKPSPYGIKFCELITEGLKAYNPLIVSGLAYGVDVTAHRKSVDVGLPTVGIMGSGLQRVYPNEHIEIAKKMIDAGGGLLTEYPSDQDPDAMHFPMRNRIIAGMSDATIVIETAEKGGSMITAIMASDMNREVLAIPGRLDDKKSRGCNDLIRLQRANLVETAEDIARILRWDDSGKAKGAQQQQLLLDLTENEQLVVDVLSQNEQGASVDFISYETKLSPTLLASLLLTMEMRGILKALSGKRYMLH